MASQFAFEAIGTHWQIDIEDGLSFEKEAEILEKIKSRIAIFDKNYSRFRADSLVSKMSKEAGEYDLSEDAKKLLNIYKEAYELTDGLVTPLIGQVLVDAGYDANYSLKQAKELEQAEKWEDVLEYAYPKLILKKPALLDFGAAGKGYLIDIVGEILEEAGAVSYCVDAGGDLRQRNAGGIQLHVGLENPDNFDQAIGITSILNESLCASAGSRRKWANFHHIIDPKKLKSPQHIKALWVTAKETVTADIISTCLFFISPEKALERYDFQYLILNADNSIQKSKNFAGEIFTA